MASAFGRSIGDFGALTPPEEQLRGKSARGELLELGPAVPEVATPENTIRAGFIRFLVLGGDTLTPVHETGVRLKGAVIAGDLGFVACSGCRPLHLCHCLVDGSIALDGATMQTVDLEASQVAELTGDGAQIKGDLFVNDGFSSKGPVRMFGAKIEGDFEGSNGVFCGNTAANGRSEALLLDNSVLSASLNLCGARCTGAIRLNGIEIKGDADLAGVIIEGRPIPDLDPTDASIALAMHRSAIAGRLFLQSLPHVHGQIRLIYAQCGALADDNSVPSGCDLLLDGFTYNRLYQSSPTSAEMRIPWLAKAMGVATPASAFRPQPCTQLVAVLAEMGFEEDAKKVAIQREVWRRQRGQWWPWVRFFHWLYGALTGYGYRPDWIVGYLLVDLVLASAIYHAAKVENGIIPVNPKNGSAAFSSFLYSLDNGLPFINFGMSKEWRPNILDLAEPLPQRPAPGYLWGIHAGMLARITMILQTIFGWIGGIALLAFLNGLARRDK